jgi:hypothetical protein
MSESDTLVGVAPAPEADVSVDAAVTDAPDRSSRRKVLVNGLIVVTTILSVVAMFAIWANRLLLSPDNWAKTSTKLLENDNVRATTANYVVDQIYSNVDVPGLIRSGLPTQLQPLAAPAAGALRDAAVKGADFALTTPQVQTLWAAANRTASQALVALVEGGRGPVGVKKGVVTLDLASVIDNLAARLGLPQGLGSRLPASIGHLTVLRSNQLSAVQDAGNAVRGLALWLTILVPVLYGLAIVLDPGHRRRTLMTVGFAIVFAGVVVFLARSIATSQISGSLVKDATLQPTVSDVVTIATEMLGEIAGAFVLVGAALIASAWFAGPARVAVSGRRAIAPFLREHAGWAFASTAAVMVVIFLIDPIPATGKPIGMVTFMGLALLGTEVLRRQTAREFPDARAGSAAAAVRARVRLARERRERSKAPAPPALSESEQLERLASLRAQDSITAEEFNAAKAKVLGT